MQKGRERPPSGNSALADTEGVESRGEKACQGGYRRRQGTRRGSPQKREAGQRKRLKPKKRRSHHSFGDLMREATRLSRICFISLISPRKKLAVSSFFENDSSLHDFLSRGLPHQQAASVESTLLKGEKQKNQKKRIKTKSCVKI